MNGSQESPTGSLKSRRKGNGSQESPTGSLKSRRKDGNQESPIGSLEPSNKIERNNGDLLHILELTGNDG